MRYLRSALLPSWSKLMRCDGRRVSNGNVITMQACEYRRRLARSLELRLVASGRIRDVSACDRMHRVGIVRGLVRCGLAISPSPTHERASPYLVLACDIPRMM